MIRLIKSHLRNLIANACFLTGFFLARSRGKVAILMYHRVLSKKELDNCYIQPGMYVLDDVFDMQMRFMKEHFHVISFQELLDIWENKSFDESKRYCVITFDDGWLDNYTNAYPILKKYDIPATIFLPTAYIGTNKWFWPDKLAFLLMQFAKASYKLPVSILSKYPWLRDFSINEIELIINEWKIFTEQEIEDRIVELAESLRLELPKERVILNWQEIEEMSGHKISFGSHSSTHKILTNHTAEVVQKEVVDSMGALKNQRINYLNVFCYPNGNYNDAIAEIVKDAGYAAAVTTKTGFEQGLPGNRFSLKRTGVHNDISSTESLFAFHLSGIKR